jgi:hypothetical protein
VIDTFSSWIRGIFRFRKERALPRRGAKPAIGACIVCGNLRMTIQAGLSDDLWQWLLDQGWRELTYRPDRRRYREIPASWVTRLIDTLPDRRALVLASAVEKASLRPTIGDPTAIPSYVVRD